MTLLFFDGFQDANLFVKPEWSGPFSSFPTTGRDGAANSAMTGYNTNPVLTLPSAAATCIVGFAWQEGNSPAGSVNHWVGFRVGGTNQLIFGLNAGFIEIRRGTSMSGTLLGTSSGHGAIATSVWHYIEIKMVIASTATGSVVVRLDNGVVLNLSGVQTGATGGSVNQIEVHNDSGTGTAYIDDLYVCDAVDATATQKRANNDFLGDSRILTMVPNAAGDTTQWTPSTGANWDAVNEFPPNTSDYVQSSTSGQRDLYNLTDPTGVVATAYGLRLGYYVTKSDAGAASFKPTIKENGTVTVETTALNPPNGSWVGQWGTARYVRPSDGNAWTATDLTNLQAGQDLV